MNNQSIPNEVKQLILGIEELTNELAAIPPLPHKRKNIYEIAGVHRKELANSNLLAFYFDWNEEHGFNTLFFKSLLNVIGEEDEVFFETNINIQREKDYIDLLITPQSEDDGQGYDWAILIENKINHTLNNPLIKYWNSVSVKTGGRKIGIILSPNAGNLKSKTEIIIPETNEEVAFKDITHQTLTEEVKRNLPEYYLEADERHLILLKEYIFKIEDMYPTKAEIMTNESTLELYQNNSDKIEKLIAVKNNAHRYLNEETIRVLENFSYRPASSQIAQWKHFYINPENILEGDIRIAIYYPHLLAGGGLDLFIELNHKATIYGDEIHQNEAFIKACLETSGLKISSGSKSGIYYQLGIFQKYQIEKSKGSFYENFHEFLYNTLFNKKTGFIPKCEAILEKMKSKP